MAQSTDTMRTATAIAKDIDEDTVKVKIIANGIVPHVFGNKTKAKNAAVEVNFHEWSLDVSALVQISGTERINYSYSVKRLPGEIIPETSTYKVKKDLIDLKLQKKKPASWVAMLDTGLEQQKDEDDDSD